MKWLSQWICWKMLTRERKRPPSSRELKNDSVFVFITWKMNHLCRIIFWKDYRIIFNLTKGAMGNFGKVIFTLLALFPPFFSVFVSIHANEAFLLCLFSIVDNPQCRFKIHSIVFLLILMWHSSGHTILIEVLNCWKSGFNDWLIDWFLPRPRTIHSYGSHQLRRRVAKIYIYNQY